MPDKRGLERRRAIEYSIVERRPAADETPRRSMRQARHPLAAATLFMEMLFMSAIISQIDLEEHRHA